MFSVEETTLSTSWPAVGTILTGLAMRIATHWINSRECRRERGILACRESRTNIARTGVAVPRDADIGVGLADADLDLTRRDSGSSS